MEMMTSGWTDERMDDLKHQVEGLGRRIEHGFSEQRSETNTRLNAIDDRLNSMQRTMIQLATAMIASLAGVIVTLVGLILTQL
jgi:hypothetical protein